MVRELEFEPKFLNPKPARFLSHHTASAKEQMPSQAGLSTQQGGSDSWDTVTSEEVEGNLTVYSILLVPEGTILNCPSPTHILSHTYTDTLNLFIKSIGSTYRKPHQSVPGMCKKKPKALPLPPESSQLH